MIKTVCVYCSSSSKVEHRYFVAAERLGKLIAKNGFELVFGGGNLGLMDALAKSVKHHHGKVTGVNLDIFVKADITYKGADEMLVCKSMGERKKIMEELADAFVILPGGFGTLEEFSEVLTLKQLHYHSKPIVLLNLFGYYSDFIAWMEKSFSESFVKEQYRELYYVTDDPEDAILYIQNYKPVALPMKWFHE